LSSSWDVYAQSNAVRAFAAVGRTNEAAVVLRKLKGVLVDVSYCCLASDIFFACGAFKKVILELEPDRAQLSPRYLRLLGRSYGANPETYKQAIEILDSLPEYDFYRWHNVSRFKAGNSREVRHWDWSMTKRIPAIYRYLGDVRPLDVAFSKCVSEIPKKKSLGGC
jgi:hypothetical protein